jgi:LysR family transcriptional regulator (chromosome initiation inhibitor)
MKIDPRRSEAFLAAVDSGSLEAAANQLNITPSAVSQRISALEQDLGTPLLIRTRPCRPTAPGMRLLQFLRRRELLEAEFLAETADDAVPVRVALAVNNDTLATWLLPVLAPVLARKGCWSNSCWTTSGTRLPCWNRAAPWPASPASRSRCAAAP